jgi:dihydroneopterin aldolase
VKEVMDTPSNLLEHVAGRLRDAIEAEFPWIPEFQVSVAKLDPPVGGSAAMARVTVKGGCGE